MRTYRGRPPPAQFHGPHRPRRQVHLLSACQTITKSECPDDYEFEFEAPERVMRGGSMIVEPLGNILDGPVYDEETILYADIDADLKTQAHLDMDVTGNYARPDIFRLSVNTQAMNSVEFASTN